MVTTTDREQRELTANWDYKHTPLGNQTHCLLEF